MHLFTDGSLAISFKVCSITGAVKSLTCLEISRRISFSQNLKTHSRRSEITFPYQKFYDKNTIWPETDRKYIAIILIGQSISDKSLWFIVYEGHFEVNFGVLVVVCFLFRIGNMASCRQKTQLYHSPLSFLLEKRIQWLLKIAIYIKQLRS